MKPYSIIAAINLVLQAASTALAADEAPTLPAPDLFGSGLRMFGAMVLVIAALVLLMKFMRRLGPARSGLFGGRELIRILATRPLAPRQFIAVVQVGDSILTLGVTGENISRLDKTEAEEFLAGLDQTAQSPARTGFGSIFRNLTGSGPAPDREADS